MDSIVDGADEMEGEEMIQDEVRRKKKRKGSRNKKSSNVETGRER